MLPVDLSCWHWHHVSEISKQQLATDARLGRKFGVLHITHQSGFEAVVYESTTHTHNMVAVVYKPIQIQHPLTTVQKKRSSNGKHRETALPFRDAL